MTGALYKLSSDEAQKKVQLAMNLVSAIEDGRAPDTRRSTPFYADLVSRCQWWAKATQGTTTYHGSKALPVLLKHLEGKHEAGKADLSDCETLQVFGWLLAEEDRNTVATIAAAIEKAPTDAGKKRRRRQIRRAAAATREARGLPLLRPLPLLRRNLWRSRKPWMPSGDWCLRQHQEQR